MLAGFPKLEPNGLLVVEDIQPLQDIHREFVRGFLRKLMMDVHYCGSARYCTNSTDRNKKAKKK